eukprot:11571024-Alexandrium_andersonii.AAC.1
MIARRGAPATVARQAAGSSRRPARHGVRPRHWAGPNSGAIAPTAPSRAEVGHRAHIPPSAGRLALGEAQARPAKTPPAESDRRSARCRGQSSGS